MTMVMEPVPVDYLREEAGRIAAANPPGRVLATVVLALFTAIGWAIGRTWFFVSKAVIFCALAVRYGYRQGMKVPVNPVPAT